MHAIQKWQVKCDLSNQKRLYGQISGKKVPYVTIKLCLTKNEEREDQKLDN